MTRTHEATGKTVGEAVAKALKRLGIGRDEASIEIVSKGRSGFLGLFGVTPAKVRVSRQVSSKDRAEEIVMQLLRLMGFSSQLHLIEEKNGLVIDIETAGADGLLIGKGGHTLSALEYVTNRMLQREGHRNGKIVLDVSGYKRRREDFLKNKALSLAEQVKSAGQKVTMEPLEAADRRIVHTVLKSDSGVVTKSIGHGRTKSIVVAPAKHGRTKSSSGRSPRRRSRARKR